MPGFVHIVDWLFRATGQLHYWATRLWYLQISLPAASFRSCHMYSIYSRLAVLG